MTTSPTELETELQEPSRRPRGRPPLASYKTLGDVDTLLEVIEQRALDGGWLWLNCQPGQVDAFRAAVDRLRAANRQAIALGAERLAAAENAADAVNAWRLDGWRLSDVTEDARAALQAVVTSLTERGWKRVRDIKDQRAALLRERSADRRLRRVEMGAPQASCAQRWAEALKIDRTTLLTDLVDWLDGTDVQAQAALKAFARQRYGETAAEPLVRHLRRRD